MQDIINIQVYLQYTDTIARGFTDVPLTYLCKKINCVLELTQMSSYKTGCKNGWSLEWGVEIFGSHCFVAYFLIFK